MGKISKLSDVSVNSSIQLYHKEKKIGKWWGKTYYHYNSQDHSLKYKSLSIIGRLLHLFGYEKNYHRKDLGKWLGHYKFADLKALKTHLDKGTPPHSDSLSSEKENSVRANDSLNKVIEAPQLNEDKTVHIKIPVQKCLSELDSTLVICMQKIFQSFLNNPEFVQICEKTADASVKVQFENLQVAIEYGDRQKLLALKNDAEFKRAILTLFEDPQLLPIIFENTTPLDLIYVALFFIDTMDKSVFTDLTMGIFRDRDLKQILAESVDSMDKRELQNALNNLLKIIESDENESDENAKIYPFFRDEKNMHSILCILSDDKVNKKVSEVFAPLLQDLSAKSKID